MIYAELLTKPGGDIIEKGVFMSYIELALADKEVRESGQCWTGTFATSIALNRYRRNRCMFCGVGIGQQHQDCTTGRINTACITA